MNVPFRRKTSPVLTAQIDAISWDEVLARIGNWAANRESRYVCIVNVHSVVTAETDSKLGEAIASADLATPDGAPVAWMLRAQGHKNQERINGPDLMWRYCELASSKGESIFLYGSTESTLAALRKRLLTAFPGLVIAGSISPPFREQTYTEDQADIDSINRSNANTIWVSLGCPKQETWMATHRERINGVMIGVGAAFDYHAGTIARAPTWMQRSGLEWFHRLCSEPRRLWKRYLTTNSAFIFRAIKQLVKQAQSNRP